MVQIVKIDGLSELDKALSELPKATGTNALKRELMKAGIPIERGAEALAPVLTGHLQRTIAVSQRLSGRQKSKHRKESQVEVFIGPAPTSQAVPQEFGTRHHVAQPYMRPSWDSNKMAALGSIKISLAEEIEKARKRLARKAEREAAKIKAGV